MRTPSATHLFAVSVCLATLAPRPARSQAPAEPPAPAASQPPAATSSAIAPAAGAPARSSTDESAVTSDRRTLNGHRFTPAASVRWPFTTTSLTSDLIVAYGKTTGPPITIGDRTFEADLEYAGIGGVLAYEYAFLEHFSARAILDNIIFSGIDGKSVLSVGTEAQFGFGVGGTASWQLGETLRLGALLDVTNAPNLALTVGAGLRDLADRCQNTAVCEVDTGELFGSTSVTTVQPAVAASWAPTHALGVTANVAYQNITSDSDEVDGNTLRLGLATDYDLGAVSSLPVGLLLQFAWTAPFDAEGLQHITDLGGGIFYTGRKDLSAGVQIIARRYAVAENVDTSWETFLVAMGLRYFW
jgi:hypothetical protein